MDLGAAICSQCIFLYGGLFSISGLAALVLDHIIYAIKGRANHKHIYAYGLGKDGPGLCDISTAGVFAGVDWFDVCGRRLHVYNPWRLFSSRTIVLS